MGKGSSQNLLFNIITSLSTGPKSSTEIANITGLDRTAISRNLNTLKESGFVIEEKVGNSKKFILSSIYRSDTYFNLSLDKKTNELIDSIYYIIKKEWYNITQKELFKTTVQKIMYQIIQNCNLKIPNGWYIYGGICIKPYMPNTNYNFTGISNNIISCIKETVIEYSKNNFAYESKQLQYKKENKELYNIKEKILSLLHSNNFSKNSMNTILKLYSKILSIAPIDNKDNNKKEYKEILNDYDDLLFDIIKKWDNFIDETNDILFSQFKEKLTNSFKTIWKLIALVNFKLDLYCGQYYLKKELDEHFKSDLNQVMNSCIEINSELNEMISFTQINNPLYNKFLDLIKNSNNFSNKEKEKLTKEFHRKLENQRNNKL